MELPDPILPRPRAPRLAADPLDTALVAFRQLDEPFTPDAAALIHDESPAGGCSLVLHDREGMVPGDGCLVKVGQGASLAAQICWKRPLEGRLVMIGLQFLE